MRNAILTCLFSILIFGCNQPTTDSNIPKAPLQLSRREIVIDSLNRNHPNKLFANFEVGMNEKQFEKAKSIFEIKTKRKDEYGYDANFIGGYRYLQIIPQFDNKKLYAIYFNPAPIDYEYYRTKLPEIYNGLLKDLSKNYFPIESREIPSMLSIEKGYTYTLAEWDTKERVINISIEASGVNYSLPLYIYDKKTADSLRNVKKSAEEKMEDKSTTGL